MGLKDQLVTSPASASRSRETVTWGATVRRWCRAKLSHVGLIVVLVLYTVFGGMVFRELEYPAEIARLTALDRHVRRERQYFLKALGNHSTAMIELVDRYEAAVQEVARGGLLVPLAQEVALPSLIRWSHLQAIFFASTVLTTIGYGNITPSTVEGRLFCIIFALVGIPLTVSVMADLGCLLASALPTMPEARGLKGSLTSAAAATSILLVYIAVGSAFFITWEDDWSFFDGFYFCFVTMTTIGFGDLVPSTPQYMLLCTFYTLIGLSLTSTIIELVRQQYSQSWRHLQALAETLGQLASERNPTDVQQELRKMITVIKFSKGRKAKEWEQAVKDLSEEFSKQKDRPKVVQIIVYESSV